MKIGVGIGMQYGGGLSPFLPESVEFFSRASVTDPIWKNRYDAFVRELQAWSIYPDISYVHAGAKGQLHQLGGRAVNTPWTIAGSPVTTDGGMTWTTAGTSLNSTQPTGMDTHVVHSAGIEPVVYFSVASQNYYEANRVIPNSLVANAGGNGTGIVIGTTTGGSGPYVLQGLYTPHANARIVGITSHGTDFWNSTGYDLASLALETASQRNKVNGYRACMPTVYAVKVQAGSTAGEVMLNEIYQQATVAAMSAPATKVRFVNATVGATYSGTLHGAGMYYGSLVTSHFQRFQAIWGATLGLDYAHTHGHHYIMVSGQSNASPALANFLYEYFGGITKRCVVRHVMRGGQASSYWATGGSVTANTLRDQFNDSGTGYFDKAAASWNLKTQIPVLVWMQGESDNSNPANHLINLQTLAAYWKSKVPNIRVVLGLPASTDAGTNVTNQNTMRANIAAVAAENGWTTADSAGLARSDGVHMTTTAGGGYDLFAQAIKAAYDAKWP
jgi:hypothetical protein